MNGYLAAMMLMVCAVSCELVDDDLDRHWTPDSDQDSTAVELSAVAGILAALPLADVHLQEVHAAVSSSSQNGYDEEYTMRSLFSNPGSGVGDSEVGSKAAQFNENPIRKLIEEHLRAGYLSPTKAGDEIDPDEFLKALTDSDIQIYWPYSENWDGDTFPVVTFDPEDGSDANVGYRIVVGRDGRRSVETVVVDEDLALEEPVWVVNRNSDAGYTSLEMLRRNDPDWGNGGGTIIVKPNAAAARSNAISDTKTELAPLKSLILKDFTMNRNYDSWFAGASEFFVKIGYVEDFTATTEAELRLYSPTVTDFLVVVKRNQVGIPQPFNAMLISDWSEQMTHCAFMITEDDGGTRTEWKCTALVRVASKSYGLEVSLPFNSRDDYVWRGQLSNKWLAQCSGVASHFGDVDLTFEVVEQ